MSVSELHLYIRAWTFLNQKVINKQMRAGSTQNNAKKGVFFGMVQKKSTNHTNNVEKVFRFRKLDLYLS